MPDFTWIDPVAPFHAQMVKNLNRACIVAVNGIKESTNTENNYGKNPSAPGHPPHKGTGRLQRSIMWEVDEVNLQGYVGSNYKVAKFMELGTAFMAARPWTTWISRNRNELDRQLRRED